MTGKRPLRVCLISPGELPVPATKGGAIETLIMSLVKCNETEHRMKLTVASVTDDEAENLAARYPGTEFRYFKRSAQIVELVYHYWQAIWKRLFPSSHIMSSLFYHKVLESIRGEKYDAVVFEGGESYGFKAYDKVFHGRLWYHVHANPTDFTNSAFFGNVMVLSGFVLNNWRKLCSDKQQNLFVLHNGVDISSFEQSAQVSSTKAKQAFGYSPDDVVVMYCGRISQEKGVRELVQSVLLITDPHIKLMVIGKPDSFDYSQRYWAQLKGMAEPAKSRITFAGYVPNNQLGRYYAAADIQVVPSQWEEGAGNVCIEGMAAAKPIIASNCGGIPEYVDEECAILINRGEDYVSNLADAIEQLAHDSSRRYSMGEHGRKRARLFSEKQYYHQYVDLMEKVVHNGV
ncbi:glycosyltransferase family 1 protein [Bifidobacterium reuteri]|uniref:Glycosyltransferase family 1 protein n=1 Tax=Bifidobacterium reuteri TaxID=983706 RepID=A0A5J5E7D2_9BIFI|nr:glycosyltransferase family 4 protein [Bifidobacterium reuteri]KAA8824910.1 glycosyltransferase family 1 protein [Bifidobacterium reuteri]